MNRTKPTARGDSSEIAPGIHHFNTDPFNWYVIAEDSRLTLVDAGFPGHFDVFEAGLRTIGHDIKDVEAIILTHAHADHMGFAERVSKAAKAPVLIHKSDVAAAGRSLQLPWWGLLLNAWHPFVASMLTRAIANRVFSTARISKALPFNDGDVLDVPGMPHVLHVPGHTTGEVAFYLPERDVLISGDSLITRDLYTGERGQPQVPARLLNDNDKNGRRSLDRLAEVGRVTMLPGHGGPWVGTMREAVEIARGQSPKPRA